MSAKLWYLYMRLYVAGQSGSASTCIRGVHAENLPENK